MNAPVVFQRLMDVVLIMMFMFFLVHTLMML